MNKQLKKLLMSMAKLRAKDQQWIINQLSCEQQQRFAQLQGPKLLQQAAKFKRLKTIPTDNTNQMNIILPEFCAELAEQEPLFVAIILEQGCFSWQALFISQYQHTPPSPQQLQRIKDATKAHLFQQWQQQLSFQGQLECEHG